MRPDASLIEIDGDRHARVANWRVHDATHARGDRAQNVRGQMVVVGVALVCAIVVVDEGGAMVIGLRSREKCPPLSEPGRWLLLLTLQSADFGEVSGERSAPERRCAGFRR
jgi:hypothetical protein